MRSIYLADLEKVRPVLILTRETVLATRGLVTIAPITSTVHGLATELAVDHRNGLDKKSVVQCDNIRTIPTARLGRSVGFLLDWQEPLLAEAIRAAFDLRW